MTCIRENNEGATLYTIAEGEWMPSMNDAFVFNRGERVVIATQIHVFGLQNKIILI